MEIPNETEMKYNFPSQATENWASPSLRSGEAINFPASSTVLSERDCFYFDPKSPEIGDNLLILQSLIESDMSCIKHNHHSFLRKEIENCFTPSFVFKNNDFDMMDNDNDEETSLDFYSNKISKYLKISNLYYSVKEKLYFKMKQIKNNEYNWFSKELVEECFERMDKALLDEVYDKKSVEAGNPIKIGFITKDNKLKKKK